MTSCLRCAGRMRLAIIGVFSILSCVVSSQAWAQLVPYSQDFELPDIVQTDIPTLGDDGWQVFGAVWKRDLSTYLDADTDPNDLRFNYGPFPAPNNPGSPAFSLVKTTTFEGNPPQGDQEIVVFSDYNNASHGDPNDRIESLFFQEQTIGVADVGKTARFTFLAHSDGFSDISTGTSKANAFIKTLDPGAGFVTTAKFSLETTKLDPDPNNFVQMTLSLPITADRAGDLIQFGFDVWASGGTEPSAVSYDLVEFTVEDTFGSFFSDFEEGTGTVAANPEALNNAGWRVFGAVFTNPGDTLPRFVYGPFGAPNGTSNGFSSVASGQAGPSQGVQYLNTFNDYDCCGPGTTNEGHFNGTDVVDSSIFQEFLVGSSDVGRQVEFKFDATLPSDPNSAFDPNMASATFYIRTLDAATGNTTAESLIDAATLGLTDSSWTTGSVLFDITAPRVGDLIQFGLTSRASDFAPTGILLDNISFTDAAGLDGDFNNDGSVDGLDFLEWQRNPAVGDLSDWEANYGLPLTAATTAVPEPSSLMLCILSATLLTRTRRRS